MRLKIILTDDARNNGLRKSESFRLRVIKILNKNDAEQMVDLEKCLLKVIKLYNNASDSLEKKIRYLSGISKIYF